MTASSQAGTGTGPAVSLDPAAMRKALRPLFSPRSIAVIGATERLQYGGRLVVNLQKMGFRGALYPVNPSRDSVHGLTCYPDIEAIPHAVDLAAIVIPAARVPETVRACGRKGVGGVVIISAGFAELGESGTSLEQELEQACRAYPDMRVIGPNCLGLANVADDIWTCAPSSVTPGMLRPGGVALASQSGAIAFGPAIAKCRERGIGMQAIASTGNEVDVQIADLVAAYADDPEIRAIMLVLETVRDGARFKAAVDAAHARGKRIVALKLGRSEVGAKAASLHTAALTGDDDVYDAFFRQAGIVRAADFDELCEIAGFFALTGDRPADQARGPGAPDGVGVVSHSGGAAGLGADLIAHAGATIPDFAPQTRETIANLLGGRGSSHNPADITGFMHGEHMPAIMRAVADDPAVGAVSALTHGSAEFADRLVTVAGELGCPFSVTWTGRINDEGVARLADGGVPVFTSPRIAAIAYAALARGGPRRLAGMGSETGDETAPGEASGVLRALARTASAGVLDEHASKQVIAAAGITATREQACTTREQAIDAARVIGFPVAAKLLVPGLAHKTEIGGVKLGLADADALGRACDDLLGQARAAQLTDARILVQEMVSPLIEVIVGMSRDPVFGPVLMLGLGGVDAEALRLVTWRVAPFDRDTAHEMIAEVPALMRLASGFRGRPQADLDALAFALARLSQLAFAESALIAGIDLNPIALRPAGEGICILDASIAVDEPGQ